MQSVVGVRWCVAHHHALVEPPSIEIISLVLDRGVALHEVGAGKTGLLLLLLLLVLAQPRHILSS